MVQRSSGVADTVYVNGPVFTADSARSWTDAVAVRDGMITATGRERVADVTGRSTEIVSLDGRLLMPGVIDAHAHPVFGGLEMTECDLSDAADADETERQIRAYADSRPHDEWITGGGWSMDHFAGGSPTRARLDALVPDRPALLISRDRHGAWLNTRAIEAAGLDGDTLDPADGRIERESDGYPAGTFHEGAVNLVVGEIPAKSDDLYLDALRRGQEHFHSLGITAWHDALIGSYFSYRDATDTYLRAAREGMLVSRVVGAQWWDRDRGMEQVAEMIDRRALFHGDRLSAGTVKIIQDGICESFTAHLFEPYHAHGTHRDIGSGNGYFAAAELEAIVGALDHEGFQIHAHTIGDRAVSDMLDALESAQASRPAAIVGGHRGDHRHQLTHLQVLRHADIPRFRRLGAVANIQPLWACVDSYMSELTIPFLGEERAARQYLFGDLRDAGVPIAAGSDWPVSSAHPLQGAHVAVNRTPPGVTAPPFLPAQRMTLADALVAYTAGSAYANHLEHVVGSIEIGKEADLVVLDRDPFEGDPTRIADTEIDLTYVSGRLVHRRSDS